MFHSIFMTIGTFGGPGGQKRHQMVVFQVTCFETTLSDLVGGKSEFEQQAKRPEFHDTIIVRLQKADKAICVPS
jgi:hypothetical protein